MLLAWAAAPHKNPEDAQEGTILRKGGTPPTCHGKPGLEEHGRYLPLTVKVFGATRTTGPDGAITLVSAETRLSRVAARPRCSSCSRISWMCRGREAWVSMSIALPVRDLGASLRVSFGRWTVVSGTLAARRRLISCSPARKAASSTDSRSSPAMPVVAKRRDDMAALLSSDVLIVLQAAATQWKPGTEPPAGHPVRPASAMAHSL